MEYNTLLGGVVLNHGKNFKKAREKMGMTQKDAAAALGVSASFLSRVESGKQKPNVNLIVRASELFGVDEAFFLKGDELNIDSFFNEKNRQFVQHLESMTLDEIIAKYNLKFEGKTLSREESKAVIAFIRSLRSL